MRLLEAGQELDGFVIEECIHAGGMAHIYRVRYADSSRDPGFVMAMKVPMMGSGDGTENIVSFEVEHQIMPALTGPHVPRFVAAGDLTSVPYLVMEYVQGHTVQRWLSDAIVTGKRPDAPAIAKLGSAIAHAAHSLHKQNAVHLDLKPGNVLERPDGSAVLLDFGLSYHAHYPDLLAEEMRKAVGSPAYMAPEQVVGVRGDPRSDIFSIGVMLYEIATGELPYGAGVTSGGLRQRLWMDPPPLRKLRPELPEWFQEVVMRCLEPEADKRYPSAAHLAFDLANPDQVPITDLGRSVVGTSFWIHFKRWFKAAGMSYKASPLPTVQIDEVPIVMVAVPYQDVTDATLWSLRQAAARSLGIRPGARLACVTVFSAGIGGAVNDEDTETRVHTRLLSMLRAWTQGLDLRDHQTSYHVIESSDVAKALINYARGNQVSMIVMGAATHGLKMQSIKATIPIKVAMEAPCTVLLVKQELPFEQLGVEP